MGSASRAGNQLSIDGVGLDVLGDALG
jgi:hypothetical protein